MKLPSVRVVDVARRARVPYSYVWRYLENRGRIRDEERRRIEEALREILTECQERVQAALAELDGYQNGRREEDSV